MVKSYLLLCRSLVGVLSLAPGRWDAERLVGVPTRRVGTSILILGMVLAACGQPAIVPLRVQAVPWANGERSTYQITDINNSPAGTATIEFTIGATQIPEEAWTMRREVAAQGSQEVVTVEMTASGLRPAISLLTRQSGDNRREQVKSTYNQGQVDLELTTAQDITTYERINVPSDVRDQRTLLALVRALPLANGYATQINSFLPVADLLERTTIQVTDEEEVQTPAGAYTTWRIALITPDSESQAWVSTSAPYILVKFVDGRTGGTYELSDYQIGQ